MPGQDQIGAPALGQGDGGAERYQPSRRSLLRGAAGAGAAGVAATALSGLGGLLASPLSSQRLAGPGGEDAHSAGAATAAAGMAEQVVVHVRDAATGQIDIFRGAGRIRVNDRDLAARLMRASQPSPRAL